MKIPRLQISVELTGNAFHERSFPAAKLAVDRAAFKAAEFVKGLWVMRAQRLDIRRTGEYIRGIQENGQLRRMGSELKNGAFEVSIDIVNTAPHAAIVENGHPAFSMVKAIKWNSREGKIKQGVNGPYLNIPFEHSSHAGKVEQARSGWTRGAIKAMMPAQIYKESKSLQATQRMNQGPIRAGNGQFMAADRYQWGGRLERSGQNTVTLNHGGGGRFEARRGASSVGKTMENPAWKSSRYEGLFRTEQKTRSGGTQSKYTTIRTITPNSEGWNIPAKAGHHIARQVAYVATRGATATKLQEIVTQALLESMGESR